MIKMREARYCNIKLLLIFLVIYGHLIEPQINQNNIVYMQYKLIYLFHIPVFAFLSGLFIEDCRFCIAQLKKTMLLYIVLQTLVFVCSGGTVDLRYPCWILWYLLSLSCWLCFVWLWMTLLKRKYGLIILIISIIVGCVVGYVSFIDRRFSLSRTVAFFPYFWLGVMLNCKTEWKKYRFVGVLALVIGALIAILNRHHLTANFLYHAEPYGTIHNGAVLRLVCYIIGVSAIIFLLSWIPDKHFMFTKVGCDTMPAYILHSIYAIILRELYLPWYMYLMLTAIFLWIVYRVMQIIGPVYRITLSNGRRNNVNFSKNI